MKIFLGHKKQLFDSPADSTVDPVPNPSKPFQTLPEKVFHLKAALVKPEAALGLVYGSYPSK